MKRSACFLRYLAFMLLANLVWEVAQLPLMPVIPVLGAGLSPLLQWIILPGLGLRMAAADGARG